jgi:hypothetical protein
MKLKQVNTRPIQNSLLLPPLGYLLVSLVVTWPMLTHLRGWVPGFGDWGQNMWALWWTRYALLALGQSPFYTDYLFHPEGVTLLFHPLDVSDGLLGIPIYGLCGGDITYNLMIWLSFVLGGWGTYLLALYLTGHRGASFVAGLIFVMAPYHFLRIDLGHLNLSTIQWIPFYLLFVLKFMRTGRKQSAVLAILFLVLNALNSWYYVIYCGLTSLALIFWTTNQSLRSQFLPRLGRIVLVLTISIAILLPLLIPMFSLLNTTTLIGEHDPLRHSVDLYSFWVPGPPSTWATWFEDVWISYAAHDREPGASAYLGYTVILLALLALVGKRRRRQAIWWWIIALGFALLAMGPHLQIDGQIYDIPMPYQVLSQFIPAFSITGIPGRFVVMTSLALAILAAYGLANLVDWLAAIGSRHSAVKFGIAVIAGFIIILEFLATPLRLTSTNLDDFYTQIGADPEPYAILDIKWDADYLLHAQTIHSKPLVGGWLARLPEEQAVFLNQGGLDKSFLYLMLGPESENLSDPAAIKSAIQRELDERNLRYIIDHNNVAGPFLEPLLGWPVVYEGNEIIVYNSSP